MGHVIWNGGAAAVTQVDTQTIAATWASGDTLTTTLTDEGGATQNVQSTATSSTIETGVRDVHLADLQNSAQSMFTDITWAASGTDAITGTAKTGGKPFYISVAYTTAGSGTYTTASTTASAGPNDINTAANWDTSAKPVSDDIVTCNNGSHDILYGLDQSSVDLQGFRRTKDYTGTIGDKAGSFYLKYDVSNVTTATPEVSIDGTGGDTWLSGRHDNVVIRGGKGRAGMLKLTGTSTTNLDVVGGANGKITIPDGTYALSNLYVIDSPLVTLDIGSSATSITLHEQTGGKVEIDGRGCTTSECGGGSLLVEGTVAWGTLNARSGSVDYRVAKGATAALTTLNGLGAVVSLGRGLTDDQTITNTTLYAGSISEDTTGGRVIYTNPVNQKGGDITTLV